MTQWGPAIEVNGVRPDWLRDADTVTVRGGSGHWYKHPVQWDKYITWDSVKAIRLPADHPYYKATDASFTYWPGGESAPSDWDGGDVLCRDGMMAAVRNRTDRWTHVSGLNSLDVIGYRKRPELETFTDKEFEAKYGYRPETLEWQSVSGSKAVLIQPRTQAEWGSLCHKHGSLFDWLKHAGLIIEPTDAERAATLASDVAPGVACAGSLILQGIEIGRELERAGK